MHFSVFLQKRYKRNRLKYTKSSGYDEDEDFFNETIKYIMKNHKVKTKH